MRQGYSKLLIGEFVVAARRSDSFHTRLDLVVSGFSGAKEQKEEHWQDLIKKAGMDIVGIWRLRVEIFNRLSINIVFSSPMHC